MPRAAAIRTGRFSVRDPEPRFVVGDEHRPAPPAEGGGRAGPPRYPATGNMVRTHDGQLLL
jgi:hypothetical protein